MAHFVELDENNIVKQVVVVSNADISNSNGVESEFIGITFLQKLFGENTTWRQTSYNSNMRHKFATIGDIFREDLNAFISPKPFESWILNETTYEWEAPVEISDVENLYNWNEETQSWDLVEETQVGIGTS
jgi:hypothetical protein